MRDYATIQVEKYDIRSTTCDACGKFESGEPPGWVHVDSWHHDWDGASENGHHQDACSAPCLRVILAEIANDYEPLRREPTLRVSIGMLDYDFVRGLAAAPAGGETE